MSGLRALARAARLKLAESRFHLPDLPTRAEIAAEFLGMPQGRGPEDGNRAMPPSPLTWPPPPRHVNCRCQLWDEGEPGGDRTARMAVTRGLLHRGCGGGRLSAIVVFDSSLLTLRCAGCDQTWNAVSVVEAPHLQSVGLESEIIPVAAQERAIYEVHRRAGGAPLGPFTARPSPASEEGLRARQAMRSATVQPPDDNRPLAPRRKGLPIYRPR